MSEKKSQFIEVETLTDSQYVPVFGSGVDRKISKPNLFSQIKDESFSPFIYPTIAILQSADLEVDVDNPTYCRCEETEYRLYKITNAAPGVDDITLTNGKTAEYQIEYRDTGFVASVATAATGALAVFTDSTGQEIDKSVVPTNTGKALVQAADSASIAFPRKNADNTVTMRSASQYFDDIKQSATHGAAGVIKTADGTSTLAQTATDEAITPANLATLKASNAETLTGTDDTKYITPENLQHKLESDGVLIIENFAALASTPASQGQVVLLCSAPSRLFKAESGTLVSDGISVSPSATSGVGWRYLTDYNSQRKGSFSLVIDTTDDYVRDTVLPIVTSAGYRAALAVPLTSLQSDYTRMTLAELHEYCRANNSEVLAHGTNGIALDNTVAGSIGESWIRTSKFDLNRFGFDANFYVAISSVLDSKFLPETKKWFDAAYVVSGSETTPTTSTNSEDSDMYNLVRVALEGGTLSNLQKLADYAKANFRNVVFYTHDSTENLSGILSYCSSIGLECETPTEWLSRVRGIRKTNTSRGSENLINNSIFARQKTTDLAPIGWSLSTSTMTGLASYYYAGEFGYEIDINATAAAADERALFSYTYPSGPISEYTPFCFSCYAYGPNVSNTTVRMRLIAKDASNNTLAQDIKDYVIRGDAQLLYANQGFIQGGTAVSYILCIIELISTAAGDVRALISRPMLSRLGYPSEYKRTNLGPSYFKLRKNTQGSALPASTDNLVLFDNVLSGTNDFYDVSTGTWISNDGGKYIITVTLGLKSMVVADRMTIKLFYSGYQREQVDFNCCTGQMIGNCSFEVVADGAEYQIYIWHNSAADRLTTTGHDATLSITRVSD